MGLKVWNLVLVSSLLLVLLAGFLSGLIPTLNFVLLVCAIMILFITYISLTRPDQLMKVPTPLELEKIKRKKKAEESGITSGPEDKI